MDFSLSPELQELQQRTRSFIRDEIIPLEGDTRQTAHGPTEEFRRELVALGREAGLLAPHASPEYGGLGLDHVGKAVVFEEAGYSPLGPGRDEHLRARRGQHASAGGGRDAGAEGALAASAGARRDPLLLLHDRAGAGRRLRSVGAEHHGGAGRQPLA